MLTSLALERFKSWESIPNMRLAPITGLFGPNSSGKTSILQFLLMLKQTAESPDRAQVLNFGDERSLVALGTFRDVVYGHEKPGVLRWSISWRRPKALRVTDPEQESGALFSGRDIRFDVEVSENTQGDVLVKKLTYHFDGRSFSMEQKSEGRTYELAAEAGDFDFKRTRGRPWDLPAPTKCYGFPPQTKAYYQNAGFLSDLELAFEEFLAGTYYLGPLREDPQREYTWGGARPADMGQRGEKVVDAILASRERGEKISRGRGTPRLTLEQYVALWLRDLGLIHEFSVEPITKDSNLYCVKVRRNPAAADVLITDVGFGVSQILPVLALCYYVPEGSTIILEQPEIHLHPSVQAGLADVFIDAVERRNVQIIIESHSERLLRRLQLRIAEEKYSAPRAALYFCDMKNGSSQLTRLELGMFGEIANWPKGFFGDEFGEMVAMTRSAMKRKVE